jgi:peptidoglycan/xylan/chitin deacetylase (PgdA/CDA1 family)
MFRKKITGIVVLAVGVLVVLLAVFTFSQASTAASSPSNAQSPGPPPALVASLTVPILMYHYVDEIPPATGPDSPDLTVSPAQFEAEMDYLAVNGYHPVTLEEVYAAMAGRGQLPAKPVAITFDDGGRDNYTVAFPILQKHGFRATFFVITGFVGNRACMDWDQLRTMHAAGMAIESHTVTHPDLRALDAARLAEELSRSRDALAEELGEDALILSYPQGRYNATVIAAAQAAGYRAAVTTRLWWTSSSPSCYEWQRTQVSPGESLVVFGRALRRPGQGGVR